MVHTFEPCFVLCSYKNIKVKVLFCLLLSLLGGKVSAIMKGPLSPSEILIALHTMEENDEVMKNVMKGKIIFLHVYLPLSST